MTNFESLVKDLKNLGIKETDVITVHSSLKSIGEIESGDKTGAEVLIDALRACLSDGILMIPAHTFRNIREVPVFDIQKTMPCIGTLPCVAVELANKAYKNGDKTCVRSMQVSHSVVAFGKKAYEFVECDRATNTRTPVDGCYGSLYRNNGKILLIGVGAHTNSFIHMVDEYVDYHLFKDAVGETIYIKVTDYDGTEFMKERVHTIGPVAASFDRYDKELEKVGAITYGKLHDAPCMVIDAKKCFDVVVNIRERERKEVK